MIDPIQYQARKQAFEDATHNALDAAKAFDAAQRQVLDHHVNFFEKLALFNTGSIAATITMAVALRQHGQMYWEWSLFGGWIALILAMALFLLRNWSTHSHLYYTALADWRSKQAQRRSAEASFHTVNPGLLLNDLGEKQNRAAYVRNQAASAKDLEDIAKNLEGRAENDFKRLIVSERLGIVLTIAGILSILVFTIRNFI